MNFKKITAHRARVLALIAKAKAIRFEPGKTYEYFDAQEKLWREIVEFDESLGKGFKIGRLVTWPVADGRACYFVFGFDGKVTQLKHLPLGDAYQSPAVSSGAALTSAVKLAISRRDAMKILFAK